MASKRESIINAVISALTGTTGVGSNIFRSRQEPIDRDTAPAIIVRWVSDLPEFVGVNVMNSRLTFVVEVYTRGYQADALADPIAVSAYAKIMANRTLGGGCLDITGGNQAVDMDSADADACILTMEFEALYRRTEQALDA